MAHIDYEDLVGIAEEAGLPEDSIRRDYSGRYMYGAECIGFVTPPGHRGAMHLGIAIRDVLGEAGDALIDATQTDSMGLGEILYFPGFTTD